MAAPEGLSKKFERNLRHNLALQEGMSKKLKGNVPTWLGTT
jgi:hypothetical protein